MKLVPRLLPAALVATLAFGAKPNPPVDPNNVPPPAGAILDLNGQPIPGGGNGTTFHQYSAW